MREIKFRAWDRINKTMNYFDSGVIGFEQIKNYCFVKHLLPNDILLLQYTGLKEKRGKEIYEGDIIRFYFDEQHGIQNKHSIIDKSFFTEMIDSVIFEKGCFFAFNYDVEDGAFLFKYNNCCEIIGNIYENPGLIKEYTNEDH